VLNIIYFILQHILAAIYRQNKFFFYLKKSLSQKVEARWEIARAGGQKKMKCKEKGRGKAKNNSCIN